MKRLPINRKLLPRFRELTKAVFIALSEGLETCSDPKIPKCDWSQGAGLIRPLENSEYKKARNALINKLNAYEKWMNSISVKIVSDQLSVDPEDDNSGKNVDYRIAVACADIKDANHNIQKWLIQGALTKSDQERDLGGLCYLLERRLWSFQWILNEMPDGPSEGKFYWNNKPFSFTPGRTEQLVTKLWNKSEMEMKVLIDELWPDSSGTKNALSCLINRVNKWFLDKVKCPLEINIRGKIYNQRVRLNGR